MIEFQGELSDACQHYIIKKESKHAIIGMAIAAGIFCVPIVILAITWHWIMAIAIPVLILSMFLAGIPVKKKDRPLIFPDSVSIENGIMVSESKKFHYEIPIDQVKKVVDMGDWYHIYFNYHYRNQRFVCQKDLITQGTIEEFERLFNGKIEIENKQH